MADRPRDDGWWQAADGKWYPPELLDAPRPQWPTTEQVPVVVPSTATVVPSPTATIVAVLVASALSVLSAVSGFRLTSTIRASAEPAFVNGEPTYITETGVWALAAAIQYLAFATAGVLLIVFLFRTARALYARGPSATTWGKGWTIGGWFIPVANLLIPRLVVGELEKIAAVPYGGIPVEDQWRTHVRSLAGDLWWLMWVGGTVVSWVGTLGGNAALDDNGRFTSFVTITSVSGLLVAASGIPLVLALRAMHRNAGR